MRPYKEVRLMLKFLLHVTPACGFFIAASLLNAPPVHAQAVQLPTFRFFGASTTVEVPDSGSGLIGGLNSSSAGQNNSGIPGLGFRPFTNRAISGGGQGGGTSVTATIHDFDALDRQRLGPDFFADSRTPVMLRGVALASAKGASPVATDSIGGQSVADIRRQQAAEDLATQAEAAQYCEQARAAEAVGKPGVAKIYYQMAARRAAGSFKAEILAQLRRINAASHATPGVANPGSAAE
jgi:hypothetical protein